MQLRNISVILLLAAAVSIDSFSVGITYGLRKIKIGILQLLIISGISTIGIYATGYLGAGLANYLNENIARYAGSFIIIGLGFWIIFSTYLNYKRQNDVVISLKIKSLEIIIKILEKPEQADLDNSGVINNYESLILGFALALDAMAAGLGTGLSGFSSYLIPVLIGISNLVFVSSGYFIGKKVGVILPDLFDYFPGLFLIFLGVFWLF
ncbi:MAG: sporulation membrane protein YtaF [Halanaerobiales bacterium]